jgi:hypothetical protein
MSGHTVLQIVKGVQVTPGNTDNAEIGLDTIDFLATNGGFAVDTYEMKIPALKSSAVFADSPLTNGRTLISGALGNVNETIRATLSASTIIQLAAMLSKLLRFKQDCNDYWDTGYQIEPIYIKHQVSGEPGPRYALLYDIDIAVTEPTNPSDPTRDITIVIEREYGWRGLAPGANPKQWAIENIHNQKFTSGNSGLDVPQTIDSQFNLLYAATVFNRAEYTTGNNQSYVTQNFVDITADKVPGDLPALTCVSIQANSSAPPGNHQVFVSRKSTRSDNPVPSALVYDQSMIINAADMSLGANMTLAADTGAPLSQALNARRRAVFTPADNNDAIRLSSSNRSIVNHRGRYMVFCRCRQAAGSANEISMYLSIGTTTPFSHRVVTTPVNPVLQAGTGNTTYWPVSYMGVIEIPNSAPTATGIAGDGIVYSSDLTFTLVARRTAGVTALLYVSDFILIPVDEPTVELVSSNTATGMRGAIDNTGYFMHGKPDLYADAQGGSAANNATEPRGQEIVLLPGVDQRLYFFTLFSDNTSDVINDNISVGVNIVPRWSGLRDA